VHVVHTLYKGDDCCFGSYVRLNPDPYKAALQDAANYDENCVDIDCYLAQEWVWCPLPPWESVRLVGDMNWHYRSF
jgi:hypothetical protein